MALAEILQEIKKLKPFAEENLDGGSMETLAARRGRKIQSLEQIRQLRTAYRREINRNSLFIVVTGSSRDAFAKIALEELGVFTSNPESLYRDLAARVSPELYMGKETLANLFDVLGRHLEDKALELDIVGYPMLRFQDKYRTAVNNTEDFVSLVKRSINDQIGAEISGINAISSIIDTAISREHTAKTTSITLPTSDETLVTELMRDLGRLTPKVFLVVAGKSSKAMRSVDGAIFVKEPNIESVTEALKEIKSNLRKGE